MAKYEKTGFVAGKWADKADLHMRHVAQAKIVSETNPETGKFTNEDGSPKMQDVCKVMFKGATESVKVALNQATKNGLIDAFGGESRDWQGKMLGVEIDKLPGKKYPLYLIPQGYMRIEDENGYSEIVKEDTTEKTLQPLSPEDKKLAQANVAMGNPRTGEDEINPNDIPF